MGWEYRLFFDGDLRAAFERYASQRIATFQRPDGDEDELRTDVYVRSENSSLRCLCVFGLCARCAA